MRTKKAKIRQVQPDPVYGSTKVAKLVNRAMRDGKKSAAQKQIYGALELAAKEADLKPLELLDKVLDAVTPQMEVRSRRVGGAAYQVPMPIKPRRGFSLAVRWLINAANTRSSKEHHTFASKLAAEMLDALQNQGGAIQKKEAAHRMAEANKAFSHFRW
jgi:small subunit ribosomal protein S7